MEDRESADGKPVSDDKMNVAWHMKDMAGDVQQHSMEAFGEMGGHAKDMAGELQRHAQDAFGDVGDHVQGMAGEVARHSQEAAGEVYREVPVLIEHVRETMVNLFGDARGNKG